MIAIRFLNHGTISDFYLSTLHITSLLIIFDQLSILVVDRVSARSCGLETAHARAFCFASIATALGRLDLEVISCVGLQVDNPNPVGFGATIGRLCRMGEIVFLGSIPDLRIGRHIGRPGNHGRVAGRFFNYGAVRDADILSCLGCRRGHGIGHGHRQNHREQKQSIPEQHVMPPEVKKGRATCN